MAKIVLGVNNCWAVKRFVEPESWIEITATKFDIKYVQFSFDLLDPRTPIEIAKDYIDRCKDLLKEYGVEIHSTFTGLAAYSFNLLLHPDPLLRLDALDWYCRAIEVTSLMGVKATGGHIGAMSMRDYENEDRRKLLLEILIEEVAGLTAHAKTRGLNMILWEPMPISREPPSSIEEAETIIDKVNKIAKVPVKLCIDVGHACNPKASSTKDLDPYEWLRSLAKYTPCLHIQQTDGKADRHWPFTEEYNKIGIIKPDKVIHALEEGGAEEVYLFLEIIHPFEAREETVLSDIIKSVKYWKDYLS
ncbi:MAG: xylose isomerase [Thermoprotei archaeon]|nr:MAG: xylose isomerase [Thermoprotei archaeon]RLF00853.1 MAG: xylose isomerase [Thermoprotei archaeon]HDI75560.1 xylose isomerase [Thermoprotei archaeon]